MEDRSLPGTLPWHLHPATARQPCVPTLEEPSLQETHLTPAPYSIACTSFSDIPLPCAPKHRLLSRSLLPHLPPTQVLFLPSPWKSQQRQLVTARSTRLHLGLSQLGLTHENNFISNSATALGLLGSPGWSLAFPQHQSSCSAAMLMGDSTKTPLTFLRVQQLLFCSCTAVSLLNPFCSQGKDGQVVSTCTNLFSEALSSPFSGCKPESFGGDLPWTKMMSFFRLLL